MSTFKVGDKVRRIDGPDVFIHHIVDYYGIPKEIARRNELVVTKTRDNGSIDVAINGVHVGTWFDFRFALIGKSPRKLSQFSLAQRRFDAVLTKT